MKNDYKKNEIENWHTNSLDSRSQARSKELSTSSSGWDSMPERWSEGLAMTQHWPAPFLLTSCMLKRLSFISLSQNESSSVWYIFVRIRKAHLGSQDTHRHPIFRGHGELAHAHLGERIPFYVGRIPFIVVVLLVFCWGGRNLRLLPGCLRNSVSMPKFRACVAFALVQTLTSVVEQKTPSCNVVFVGISLAESP